MCLDFYGCGMKTLYLFHHSKPDKASKLDNSLIPLSEEGKTALLALLGRIGDLDKNAPVFSSPYRRAYETALLISGCAVRDSRLTERQSGLGETFTKELWAGQYTDCDLKNTDGESFLEVRKRMAEAINEILDRIPGSGSAVIVSHAAAICAYLQQFCRIEVVDTDSRRRKITHGGRVILDGVICAPSCFRLMFEEGYVPSSISHIC